MTDDARLLTVAEVADRLRSDESTVRRRIRTGQLEATKPCGQYLVSEAAVEAMLARARVKPVASPPVPRSRRGPAPPPPPTGQSPGGSFRSRRGREAAA